MKRNKIYRLFSVFARLTRIRLSILVSFSALTGFLLTGISPDIKLFPLLIGVFLLSAGSTVLNQIQERRQDALMLRTLKRPIPTGEVSVAYAALICLVLIVSGTFLLSTISWIPALLGLLNISFYNFIYTPLKTRTWLAIVPGALVGGVPPLIGWSAAGQFLFHPNAIFLFVFVFLWQVPHFWLLMIKYGKEYELAGFSSITSILLTRQIRTAVFSWGVFTSFFLMLFPLFGFDLKPVMLVSLTFTNLFFIQLFYRFLFQDKDASTVRKAFILINSYAVLVFILLILNALIF